MKRQRQQLIEKDEEAVELQGEVARLEAKLKQSDGLLDQLDAENKDSRAQLGLVQAEVVGVHTHWGMARVGS